MSTPVGNSQGILTEPWQQVSAVLFNPSFFARPFGARDGKQYESPLIATFALTHEFGHQVHGELMLSDHYFGTDYHRQLNEVVRILLPKFDGGDFGARDLRTLKSLGFKGQGARYHEVVAQLFALGQTPVRAVLERSPFVVQHAASRLGQVVKEAWEPQIRESRQRALLELASQRWLQFDCDNDNPFHFRVVPRDKTEATFDDDWRLVMELVMRETARGGGDPRYVAMTLQMEILNDVAVGISRISRLPEAARFPDRRVMQAPYEPVFDLSLIPEMQGNALSQATGLGPGV